jgi:hypothetical protein
MTPYSVHLCLQDHSIDVHLLLLSMRAGQNGHGLIVADLKRILTYNMHTISMVHGQITSIRISFDGSCQT